MRWAACLLLVLAMGAGCSGGKGGGGPQGEAARQAALRWAASRQASDYYRAQFLLLESKGYHVTCTTVVPLTDDDKAGGLTGVWCVQVGFLGRLRTFDGSWSPWDEHSILVTVKAQKGGAPAATSWADCLCTGSGS